MNCRPSFARNGNHLPLHRGGARRLFNCFQEIEVLSPIVLILLVSAIPGDGQNTASLTIQGVMPAAQRLSISPIQTTIETNRIIVTLDAKNNAAAGYAVTIQSNAPRAGTNGSHAAYQLKCGGRPMTLAPGTSKLISDCTSDRFAKATLQISNPSDLCDETLTITVITQ